jgi:enoyl-CoA hydratase
MTELVILTRPADGVALLRLSRPEARNAFNAALLERLAAVLHALDRDAGLRAAVVTGGADVFGAGGDLAEMAASTPVELWASSRHDHWGAIHQFRKPLIAAVNGPAFGGGCELALACDIVVAGENARFALPEVRLGFVPGRGGTQRLPAMIGKSAAMHMILTGEPVDAQAALRLGLVWEVTAPEATIERALAIAQVIATRPPVAVQIAKELVSRAASPLLEQGMATERHCYEFLVGTSDAQEGMEAFLGKRAPAFSGK